MKKNILLLLLGSALLAACASEVTYTPRKGGKYVPFEETPDEETAEQDETELITCTYNFYFSYSHTTKFDEVLNKDVASPILILRDKPMFSPLGATPTEVDSKEKLLALAAEKEFTVDETFNKFLGFSYYTVCLDEEGIWDFTKDTKQQAIINLYGVWVSE